ncbi:DUF2235 domain-containing protein [uncultured Aquabacterium sp.]|uniref:phospholipase effector Tle1 domain-containing protein n=1 Tax=uncultured Aquabacterium sp. TaxID=158753 RepID=UPI002616D0B4|nr:DUF2235 domain-containing protein [uncultured Aquabacterium sp.]
MINASKPADASTAGPATRQPYEALSSSAAASTTLTAPVCPPPQAPLEGPDLAQRAQALDARLAAQRPAHTCRVTLKIAFFFDGTGNNLDADEGTDKHSNVARLFKAHPREDIEKGVYAHYIPGLGTYFKDIGDIGDDDGMAFGKYGDARLDQAMKWLDATIAKHPSDKIEAVNLAIFGFSRGATLARAFARRVDSRCYWNASTGKATLTSIDRPCEIYFLGLFDTVASVGLPASTSLGSLAAAKKWMALDTAMARRRNWLNTLAFGDAPGADPTPGAFDGHGSWARNLRIPPLVTRTVHLMAMNEFRNSFPLDTVWDGANLPAGAQEVVYPGAHSNVGGGYRPGEGGKSPLKSFLLSKIPLRRMYEEAVTSGVPLKRLSDPAIAGDFEFDSALGERFNKVLSAGGFTEGRLGDALLANSELYYRWRFRKIRLRLRDQEYAEIKKQNDIFRKEDEGDPASGQQGLQARVRALEQDPARLRAEKDMNDKKSAWLLACQSSPDFPHEQEHQAYLRAKAHFDDVNDAFLRERAKQRALPDYSDELIGNLDIYDKNLLKDIEYIKAHQAGGNTRLRPHYQRMLKAYEDEFIHGKGLSDPLVIEFFDHFVHDSLAGFAKDETLPSDPRCCYIGGDKELKFANNRPLSEHGSTAFG